MTGNPLGSAAVLGGMGALTGWFAGPWAAEKASRRMLAASGLSPEEIEEEIAAMRQGPMRRNMALGLGLGAAGLSLLHNYDSSQPWYGLKSWKRATASERRMTKQAQVPANTWASSFPLPFQSEALHASMLNPLVNVKPIPVGPAKQVIFQDPNIGMGEKAGIMGIFNMTDPDKPVISASGLGVAAVKAGVGYATGYALGSVLSEVMGLPPTMTKALSRTGGIANALANVGVLGP